jgi:structural maintenance of chromosome 2
LQKEGLMASPGTGAKRNILLAVDDSEASERACQWMVDNLLRPDDEVHLFHVVAAAHAETLGGFGGVGGVDELIAAEPDPAADRAHIEQASEFIDSKFVPKLRGAAHKVEIVRFQTGAEAVGEVLCQRASDLKAVAVVMASHNKGAVQRFFLGSATEYCARNCSVPIVVLH